MPDYNVAASGGVAEEKVYIVLSLSNTFLSRTIGLITGDKHAHSALALDRSLATMYSFGRRRAANPFIGCYKHERLDDKLYMRMKKLPGTVLELPVTRSQLDLIKKNLGHFDNNRDKYSYNVLGLFFGVFGREHERENRFFCSEFVYYILRESGVCDFGVPRGLVRPESFLKLPARVIFQGNLRTYYGAYEREEQRAAAHLAELVFPAKEAREL